jgi:hypothetical protein
MYGRSVLMMIAAGSCSHADQMRESVVECRSSAKGRPVAGLTAEQACALVRERVRAALAGSVPHANLTIDLDLSRPGSAIARIQNRPDIAVDVMDRTLNSDDLLRLADAIVSTISTGPQPQ